MESPAADTSLSIGMYEVLSITDTLAPFPEGLSAARVFPSVAPADWPLISERYASSFYSPMRLLGRVGCYLLRWPGHTMLVDSGLGAASGPDAPGELHGRLIGQLARAGIAPEHVDLVFLTHLHPDHVGWNMQHSAGAARPTFPNARYLAPRAEWHVCEQLLSAQPDAAAYVQAQLLPLREQGQLELLDQGLALAEGLRAIETPGHSPGHMSIEVFAGSEYLLIAGDAFHHPLQLAQPDAHFGRDGDAQLANRTRAQLLARFPSEQIYLGACHFPLPGLGRVSGQGAARIWRPLGAG